MPYESILNGQHMENLHPIKAPCDLNITLEPNRDGAPDDRSNPFASLMGSLQYLATATRPDIAYAVNRLSAFTANPSKIHWAAAKRLLRYLAGTKDYGITYHKDPTYLQGENLFYGYGDAAYANSYDYKSTSGYVFIAFGGAITWGSKKQLTVALSSTEAEYVAISEAARDAMWLRSLHSELGFQPQTPILILGDNNGSIALAKNPGFHKRTKHIAIRWHWIRELIDDELIHLIDCRDPQNTADILTKALPPEKSSRHTRGLGLGEIDLRGSVGEQADSVSPEYGGMTSTI
jgi:hypothetical protein